MYDCWFGFAFNSVYADRDGYIRNDSGFLDIDRCLFAGGPADSPVGTGATNGTEIAYINCGMEVDSGDVAVRHARVSIRNTRIGYEQGAGVLVNYFTPYAAGGQNFRSGIVLHNIQTSPREEQVSAVDGTGISTLIRLFTMPHQIILDGTHTNLGNAGLIEPGSSTTLKALRESVSAPVDYTSNLSDQESPTSENQYIIDGFTGVNTWIVASQPTATINNGAGYSTGTGITMTVDALPKAIASGEVLTFTGGGVFTLTADAGESSTSITGDLATAAVADDEVGTGQPTIEEHQKWLELFDRFNYFFASDFPIAGSSGNATEINIDTWFAGFDTAESSVFKVYGGAHTNTAASTLATCVISGTLSITNENNSSQDRITAYYDADIDYSAQIADIEITPFFVVSGSPSSTITQAQASAGATLRLRIRHAASPGSVNVRCRGLVIKPMHSLAKSNQIGGFIQS
jgi:hypothetical protein